MWWSISGEWGKIAEPARLLRETVPAAVYAAKLSMTTCYI